LSQLFCFIISHGLIRESKAGLLGDKQSHGIILEEYIYRPHVRRFSSYLAENRRLYFAETKIWFCLRKHTSTMWGQHVTSLGGIYSYHLAVSATHFVRFHPKPTYKLIVLNCLLDTCDTVARYSECTAHPLTQSHPANSVMFNPLPSPNGPQRAHDTSLRKPLKLFCVGNLPCFRETRTYFSWFASVCLRNCWPQRPKHLTGYSETGPGEICSRMCTFLTAFVWSSALENGQIQRIAARYARLLNIST
jgi:hypothetical protein